MSSARARIIPVLASAIALPLGGACLASSGGPQILTDAAGDAAIRRTDPGANGPINPLSTMPDVVELRLGGWTTPTPTTDPYTGSWVAGGNADLLRLDLVLAGVVNPPGTLGLGAHPFNPYQYGPSPIYGFIDLDIDRTRNTGGELGSAATQRFLANIARFGALPYGSLAERAARSAADYDGSFFTGPQFERSGEDFALVFCGCFGVYTVDTFGDTNGAFDAGDTWIVRGRFFQRAAGYEEASAAFGGSFPGLYDPSVRLRFQHSTATNRTTISLVYPLRMAGAALLAGEPVQPIDLSVSNHTSVVEALTDVIDGALEPVSPEAYELSHRLAGRSATDYLDPSDWRVTMIVGTSYAQVEPSLYAWTDYGFECLAGDFDADGALAPADVAIFDSALASRDGGSNDADGAVNGAVVIPNFGVNFDLLDLTGDGVIDASDRDRLFAPLPGDADLDCMVGLGDVAFLIQRWATSDPAGDLDRDGLVGLGDLAVIINHWATTCR